jgi:hypothetical protein
MAKAIAEQSNKLSIFWLKKYGYLCKKYSYNSGGIKWIYGYENECGINFSVIRDDFGTTKEKAYINLRYASIIQWSGEKEKMDYKIWLTTTPCRYGGKRYWFICPMTKEGKYCGRRVGVLFGVSNKYGCRHCAEVAYNSQMYGGRHKGFVSIPDIEQAEKEVKRRYYNGRPTRKYRRVMRLSQKFGIGCGIMIISWNRHLAKLRKK